MLSIFLRAAALALTLTLLGCAGEPTRLPLGASRDDALRQLGRPSGSYALPNGGTRLQYSRQPAGFQVHNVDLDANGRVVAVTQVLSELLFGDTIQIDQWRIADVLRTYGAPEEVGRVSSFEGQVWQWRYLQINEPRLLYIYIDAQGVVRRYHVGDDLRRIGPADRK